jgi:SAM-dependent methyltransferase
MPRRSRYNGDAHLRLDQRAAYLASNFVQNQRPYRDVDRSIAIVDFQLSDPRDSFGDLPDTPSPSRALSNLFWLHLPWEAMERELGGLRVLDLGCGSGKYAQHFQKWSGGRIIQYTGLDQRAHPRWAELSTNNPSINFVVGDIERLGRHIPADTTLIVSQSAIEHVGDDARCFDALHEFAAAANRPLAQVHLMPSAACLSLYLWHGYRQYTPRTLSSLSRPFAGADRTIVRLGGAACNRLHWQYVTWPLLIRRIGDLRDQRPAEYRRALEDAVVEDMRSPHPSPSFYALIVQTGGARALSGVATQK